MVNGFQWLDGSFLEDVETTQGRAPRDIDVVTFYSSTSPDFNARVAADFPDLLDPARMKARYAVDHYLVDLRYDPAVLVDQTRYWYGLFSHTRDGIWKGMLRLPLNTSAEDQSAGMFLDSQVLALGGNP